MFHTNDAAISSLNICQCLEPQVLRFCSLNEVYYCSGWVMRLYFDLDKTDPIHAALCKLACSDTNLDICDAANLPGTPMKDATKVFAMNWRFFPTLDPQVSKFFRINFSFIFCPFLLRDLSSCCCHFDTLNRHKTCKWLSTKTKSAKVVID